MQRHYGMIYGVCIGDALGGRYEFRSRSEIMDLLKKDMRDTFLPILGGGVFNLEPGQVTDDAEMALELLVSLKAEGRYSQNKAAKRYIDWFQSNPVDYGRTINIAIKSFTLASQNAKDMKHNSKKFNTTSLSNGSLMRIAPVALLGDKALDAASKDCRLTHPNPLVIKATELYVKALLCALKGMTRSEIYKELVGFTERSPTLYLLVLASYRRPEPHIVQEAEIFTEDSKYQGYFGIALQNAFYELFHGASFEASLLSILKRGGDTDTNCCIAGALLGAFYGLDQIPKEWVSSIRKYTGPRSERYPFSSLEEYINAIVPGSR